MIIESLAVGPLETNCYIAACPETNEAAVIDPGGDGALILDHVRRLRAKVLWILNTHGHGDHIGANAEIKAAWPDARLAIHEDDAPCLLSATRNLSAMIGMPVTSPPADVILRERDEVAFGRLTLRVLHIPGHTPGGVAFYWPGAPKAKPVLFSGDALFLGSIGRSDFPGGDFDLLITGIRTKLLTLPPATLVYSGHGAPTTIDTEARSNPFL